MTVIYSNSEDADTIILQEIWRGIPDVNVIEITSNTVGWEDVVNDAINNEDDTLIFAGHGTIHGLLAPLNYSSEEYILHKFNVNLIHAKRSICIWCMASTFCFNHRFESLATSMFISNPREAFNNGCCDVTRDDVERQNILFYRDLNYLLQSDIPFRDWRMKLKVNVDMYDDIDVFNRNGLCYILSNK